MRRIFGVDMELDGETLPLDSPEFNSRYLLPAAAALRNHADQFKPCEFLEQEVPKAIEYGKLLEFPGIPVTRFIAASTWRNYGTEEEPDYRFVRIGRLDCLVEDGKSEERGALDS